MKTKRRALADYIAKFGTFPCGERVKPDGSNAQFSKDYDRKRSPVWRLRCLRCNRQTARIGMARYREASR